MSKRFTSLNFYLLCFLVFPYLLYTRQVETFYGSFEIKEPVLLELIDSPSFQRLKEIHQYGISYYTTHQEEYNRYEHSLGVFALLRANKASLAEQIAGLLHDVSHTAFSHVGDWVFGKETSEKDYQNEIHADFLEKSGLAKILKKYNFSVEQILPLQELFPALENNLPDLCADRIDYNIQGAYHQGFITYQEALLIFKDLHFVNNCWFSHFPKLMEKLTRFSLFMTKTCWGGPANYITSRWLADAILRAIDIGCISYDDLHFGTDQVIWDRLTSQKDPIIAKKMEMIKKATNHFVLVNKKEEADFIIKSKFRGINPWIKANNNYLQLIETNQSLKEEYQKTKETLDKGWLIKIITS